MNEIKTILELKETIKAKDREIKDIKRSIFERLQEIRDINESNDYPLHLKSTYGLKSS